MIRKLTILLVMLCLLSPLIDHRLGYIFLGGLAMLGLLRFDAIRFSNKRSSIMVLLTPAAIFGAWVYGVISGFLHGNEVEYVVTNFLGLAFYPAFYGLLASRVTPRQMILCVFAAASVYFVYGGWVLLVSLLEGSYFTDFADSISDYRVLYVSPTLYLVPFIAMALLRLSGATRPVPDAYWNAALPSWATGNLFLLAATVVFVFLSMSKGFIAVVAGLVVICGLLVVRDSLTSPKARHIAFFFLAALAVYMLVLSDLYEFLIFSFSSSEVSNATRSEQLGYLLDEISLLGAGLGAVLMSGHVRTPDAPYGFELTFFNIIHKLGWMAIPLFVGYLLPLIDGLRNIFTRTGSAMMGGFLIGGISFIIPGYANPLLLATNFVMLHCICLFVVFHASSIAHFQLKDSLHQPTGMRSFA